MTQMLLKNFTLLDPERDELSGGHEILIEGEKIREVSAKPIKSKDAAVVDCGGKTVMPGLIDSHVHVFMSEVVIRRLEDMPLTLMTARAAKLLHAMIDRGFTTVRDTGGADWGIKAAVDQGYIPGPRLFIAGKAIGPTGGHSDGRRRTDPGTRCHCCNALAFTMGHRRWHTGRSQGGARGDAPGLRPHQDHDVGWRGVALRSTRQHAVLGRRSRSRGRGSPRLRPLRVRHAYSPEAITRAAHAGVRTIEHGNLIDEASAKLMAEKNMFLIANLVAYFAMRERATEFGMNAEMLEKNDLVIDGALALS